MKIAKILKYGAMLATTMIAGMVQTNAATTNLVQNLTFALTFFEQGPTNHPSPNVTIVTVNKVRVNTRDIIAVLGAATSNNFSANARLVLVKDVTSTNDISAVEVRDGTNIVDVSDFFSKNQNGSVFSSRFNSATGIGSGFIYSIFHLTMNNDLLTASFDLHGFATTTHTGIKNGNTSAGVDEIDADVAGTGTDANGVAAVIAGRINVLGRTLRVE